MLLIIVMGISLWFFVSALFLPLITPGPAIAATYYIAPTGSDSNSGASPASAFKTFNKSMQVLQPGDTLYALPGTYPASVVSKSGTSGQWIKVIGDRAVISGGSIALSISGNYLDVSGLEIINAASHGILINGKNIKLSNFSIHDSVTENKKSDGSCGTGASGGWGSALSIKLGSENVQVENGVIYRNCGEGMAATRTVNTHVSKVTIYDNFSVNFYIDNSKNVTLERNFAYCTNDSRYYRDGKPAGAYVIGEEYYSGWGSQLENIKIVNNAGNNCGGISFYRSEVGSGLKGSLIAHNTLHNIRGTSRGIYISQEPQNRDIKIHNNIANGSFPSSSSAISVSHNLQTTAYATNPSLTNPLSLIPANNSTAVDQGINIGINTDWRGASRPQGGGVDIGAFEAGSTPNPSPKPGDLNNDGRVDIFDYNLLVSKFGNPYTIFDFNAIVINYGK